MEQKMASHPAVQVLQAFFLEMDAWESEAARHHRSVDWGNADQAQLARDRVLQRQNMEQIFEQYCEVGKQAERLQDQGLSFNLGQPEHEGETVVRVTERAGKVLVETEQPQSRGWEFRYELLQIAGEWRLRDRRKRRCKGQERWSKDLL